jgi:hypothetical protein
VEVNPDFVEIVRDQKEFDGGIYSDFSNVKIIIEEGRHYVKQLKDTLDLIVMALPSTEQMQNIQPFAMSENFLLTKEAVRDYLKKLTSDGRLILTVHNGWELMRLTATAIEVFQDMGVAKDEIKDHFVIFEADYAPTVVIKKNVFTPDESLRWENTCKNLPRDFPNVTYLPCGLMSSDQSTMSNFLMGAAQSPESLNRYISASERDISPCNDDKPYFYNIHAGVPGEYLWLLAATVGFNVAVVWLPLSLIGRTSRDDSLRKVTLPFVIVAIIGIGFMVMEVSLFQKLVLYLGSPTISLSVLLSSLLIGMGTGSYFGSRMYRTNVRKRLLVVSFAIVVTGILLVVVSPFLLIKSLEFGWALRTTTSFLLILPLAVLLGIPFPSCIQLLALDRKDRYIPWLYGVNGSMSVLGSVLAVIVSMLFGFTPAYFFGLCFYLSIFLILFRSSKNATPA